MSELFTLYFVKKILTEPEFCRGLIKTASFLTDNASAILENRLADLRLSAELADIKTAAFQVAIEKKVLDIFTVYGVYWPKYQTGAIFKDALDKFIPSNVFCGVTFGNAADQYAIDVWDDDVPLFRRIKRDVTNMTSNSLRQFSNMDADILHLQQMVIYQKIYKSLELERWIYGDSGNFKRYAIQGITHSEMRINICAKARSLVIYDIKHTA